MQKSRIKLICVFLITLILTKAEAQTTGNILVISNSDATAVLDGLEIGNLIANKPGKFEVSIGEHYLQIIPLNGVEEKNEVLNIEASKQKVLKYEFESPNKTAEISSGMKTLVAELDVTIPGITAQAADDFSPPYQLYAFEAGDEIVIDLEMYNLKGTNTIEIISYPSGNAVYSKNSFQNLSDLRIKVQERSIYGIVFYSNFIFDRTAKLTVNRIPASEATANFNPSVSWQTIYRAEDVQKPQKFYINSGSHATFKGGKSRISLPLNFPENTVKWYYEFSASRDEDEVDRVSESFNLAGELSNIIDKTGLIEFGISQLTQPPGSDYCDIYLLSHENSSLFTSKSNYRYYTEGTRENLKSGIIEVECCTQETIYLGLRNPDNFNGIHVVIEVVAIVQEEGYMMDEDLD